MKNIVPKILWCYLLVSIPRFAYGRHRYGHARSTFAQTKKNVPENKIPEVCSSDLNLQISTAEYDFIIKEFERAEVRERKNKNFPKNSKRKDTSIPGFISEEITLLILSEVFKKRGFSDKTISEFLMTRKNNNSNIVETPQRSVEPERPGCRCVDSFFLDLSPPRLPRRHRLPHGGFIPKIYNLGDICEIALDLLNSDMGMMQRSRSLPLAQELVMGTENMKRILQIEDDTFNLKDIEEGKDPKEKIEKILEKLAKIIDVMRTRIKSI